MPSTLTFSLLFNFLLFQPAIDLLTTILRHAQPPISEVFVNQAFPLIVKRVMESDDEAIIQVSWIVIYI